jgi:hypothetical protein
MVEGLPLCLPVHNVQTTQSLAIVDPATGIPCVARFATMLSEGCLLRVTGNVDHDAPEALLCVTQVLIRPSFLLQLRSRRTR